MTKQLLSLLVFLCAFGMAQAQEPMLKKLSKNNVTAQTAESEDLIGLTNGIPDSGYGYPKDMELAAGVELSPEYLQPHVGKQVKMIRFFVSMPLTDVTAFVRLDSMAAEIAASVKIDKCTYGWNNAWLETPYEIPEGKTLFLGYEFNLTNPEGGFPMIVDNGEYIKGGCWLKLKGEDQGYFLNTTKEYPDAGNLLIQGLVGDEKCLNDMLNLTMVNYNNTFNINEEQTVTLIMHNFGLNEVENAKVSYEFEGRKEEQTLQFQPAIQPTEETRKDFNIKFTDIASKGEIKITVTEVNGQPNGSPANSMTCVYDSYSEEVSVPRTVLIEKHTGQDCPNCPLGTQAIHAAIEGLEDKVALVEHHTFNYVNNPDMFFQRESGYYASFFQTSGAAPYMMMDRYPDPDNGVLYVPATTTITKEKVEAELNRPAFVTVNIENDYNSETRELNVTVKGKRTVPLSGKQIGLTVIVTQSGYEAYQLGSGDTETYKHDNFPILFMSNYKGDAVTFDENGEYEMTYSEKIRSKLSGDKGDITTDPHQMKVVAFINNWDTRENSEVFNAAFRNVNVDKGISSNSMDGLSIYAENGCIKADGACDSMEVFDLTGKKVRNANLADGLYIVKATKGNDEMTVKVIVK